MAILIIGIVTAANASLVRSEGSLLLVVATGALVLNSIGYAAGWLASRPFEWAERIAATLSIGMREGVYDPMSMVVIRRVLFFVTYAERTNRVLIDTGRKRYGAHSPVGLMQLT